MQRHKHWGLSIALAFTLCAAAFAADAPAPIQSDGAYLNEAFDGAALPAGWVLAKDGSNRAAVSFQDGRCLFNPGKGDNNVALPPLKINLEEPFVIEITFTLPAPTGAQEPGAKATHATAFSIFCMSREGGEFQAMIAPTDDARCVIMTGSRPLGIIQPGKPYTLAVLVQPDGAYKGTLAGPDIVKPVVQSVTGARGPIKALLLGNVNGSAVGSLSVDSIKIGKPAP